MKATTKIFTIINGKPSGFTLVELLLVVVIIVLLAGTGGSFYFRTYKRMLVEKAAKEVVLAAKYARVLAIEKGLRCRLILDETDKKFCLTIKDKNSRDDEKKESMITDQYSRPREFGGDVRFEEVKITSAGQGDEITEEERVIVFRPDGTADTAILQIGDSKNHYTVYIMAATGKAHVKFGEAGELPMEIIDLDMVE